MKIKNQISKIKNKNWKLEIGNWRLLPIGGKGFTQHQNGAGFTLIELLIVVAIIAILSTLLMVNFIAIRQRARDAERKSSLKQIQIALEIYRADQGDYPTILGNCNNGVSIGSEADDCATIYMQKIPVDPNSSTYFNGGNYFYSRSSDTTYVIVACLENKSDPEGTSTLPVGAPADCSSGYYYGQQNP